MKTVKYNAVNCVRKDEVGEILDLAFDGVRDISVTRIAAEKKNFPEFGHPALLQGFIDAVKALGCNAVRMY